MLIEMIDGEPPYFNMPACDAMTCLRDLPPPRPRNTDNVSVTHYRRQYCYFVGIIDYQILLLCVIIVVASMLTLFVDGVYIVRNYAAHGNN